MAERLEVSARWLGGYRACVQARGHRIRIDEPMDEGGADSGMMPTEALCAALASCFCLALAHVGAQRGQELPGLRVVVRARRAGRELRYEQLEVEAQAETPAERLAPLIEPARRVCWVSNTLARGVQLGYTTVDARTRK